jgi:hypothetical protein
MAEENLGRLQRRIRSPRSAAIAGLVFSVLLIAQLALTYWIGRDAPVILDPDFMDRWSGTTSVVLNIVPFLGIAFLWFTGVIRDWLGEREDRFFSTIFFGSGIIFVVLLFIYAAVLGAIYGSFTLADELGMDKEIVVFGFALMNQILGNYAMRMAGVYMLSIGTLWTRTGRAPRWLIILTYVVAIGFLLFAGWIKEAQFIFPVWVFVVSIYILILNYRQTKQSLGQAHPPESQRSN